MKAFLGGYSVIIRLNSKLTMFPIIKKELLLRFPRADNSHHQQTEWFESLKASHVVQEVKKKKKKHWSDETIVEQQRV